MTKFTRPIGLAILYLLASPMLPAQVPTPQRLRLTPDVTQKRVLKRVDPTYTSEMRRDHLQGVVKLKIQVSKQGGVEDARAISGNPQLAAAAINAVKQWKYSPFILNGEPVAFETTVDVNFSLAGS